MRTESYVFNRIRIVTRDINGNKTLNIFSGQDDFFENLNRINDDEEILLVFLDDNVIYSAIRDQNAITMDDLTGFFA